MARTKQTARRSTGVKYAGPGALTGVKGIENKEPNPKGPAGTKTEWKRVDEIYDESMGRWVVRESAPWTGKENEDAFYDYCFVVNRKFEYQSPRSITTIVVKSDLLRDVLHKVIGNIPPVSWHVPEVSLDPKILITFYPPLYEHLEELQEETIEKEEGKPYAVDQLALLLDFVKTEYDTMLTRIDSLLDHGEITFDLLWAIMLPNIEYFTADPKSGQPRAVILKWATEGCGMMGPFYSFDCEYIEAFGNQPETAHDGEGIARTDKKRFGRAKMTIMITGFQGAVKTHQLRIFPMDYHPKRDEIRTRLIERGRKWAAHDGIHHKHYNGIAFLDADRRIFINSRVMVDKATFRRINPNWSNLSLPKGAGNEYDIDEYHSNNRDEDAEKVKEERAQQRLKAQKNELSEEDFLLATPIVYGFALADKEWVEMDIDSVNDFEWNEEAFANLVLPPAKKMLIQALVEAHAQKGIKFEDFIAGKGQGLVINLFGPPGVGKTMSAEATSEHVRKPLYVVGAGDLGTNPRQLDDTLDEIFDIAHVWGAVVLIDEADVFLEARSVHDIERNALVAVFLRQLEYFAGILFLTTNRIKAFDEAFQSRIHISLRYTDLEESSRRLIWKAFLTKVGAAEGVSEGEWDSLARAKLNGRQIKNAVRTAQALAASTDSPPGFSHISQVLSVMAQFEEDMKTI